MLRMNEREIASKNKILQIRAGSHLYGTSTADSDEDFIGIFMPDKRHIFGLNRFEEVDLSIKSKNEEGKNTSEAVDNKLYEYRKFMKLAIDNNPQILELLFASQENITFINEFGKRLLEKRSFFPWMNAKKKLTSYAYSQRHKIFIKRDNYLDILNGLDYLKSKNSDIMYLAEAVSDKIGQSIFKTRFDKEQNTKFIQIGDLNLQPYYHLKRAKEILKARIDKFGNRFELVEKHGFDTKFAYNLIRLLYEGRQILKTCELSFPFQGIERETLLEIKTGKWSILKILDHSNELQKEIDELEKETKLPSTSRFNEIESFTISEIEKFINSL